MVEWWWLVVLAAYLGIGAVLASLAYAVAAPYPASPRWAIRIGFFAGVCWPAFLLIVVVLTGWRLLERRLFGDGD